MNQQRRQTVKAIGDMTVLVTGASGDIGSSIAQRFASVGMNVIIHYMKSHEAANETARRCIELGSNAVTVCADLRSKEQIDRMLEKLHTHRLYPDVVVNNAAVSHYAMLSDITEEDWDTVMDINVKSVFLCTQAFMPYMIRQRYGRIINVSSIWGLSGASCEVLYSTTKGGVNAFTKALAKELAPSGVTVNAVAPGAVSTSMMAHLDEKELQQLEHNIPAGRLAQPDEISSLVYFLAIPESGYINGQIISPNGGWLT